MIAAFLILGGAALIGVGLVYANRHHDTEPFLSADADQRRAFNRAMTKEPRL